MRVQLLAVLTLTAGSIPLSAQEISTKLCDDIRREAVLANRGAAGRPLPLAAHWNCTGMYREGFTPTYQLELLKKGRHILPWLEWPPTDRDLAHIFKPDDPRKQKYIDDRLKTFEKDIKELARLKLPITFLATQWESHLTYDKAYFNLPAEQNPNVIGLDGKVRSQVCPFGPIEPWRSVGRAWTDNFFLKKIQEWHPDPPLVLLVSNNEHAKQQWSELEQSKRYMDKYGKGKTGDFKRKVVSDGWIERYGAMLQAMRDGLENKTWQKNIRFIGYEAFPPVHFGRWGGWKEYSLYAPGQLDPQPLVWDGGSPSYYLHNWMAITDYTLWSPQVETMNWVFMLDEIHKTRPNFWFELSTWDGDQPGAPNDKRKFFAGRGRPYTPARYEGLVQYGMWLTRPRTVRDFRSHTESVEYAGPYFEPILDAVDRVWSEPTLNRFWRHGALVVNRAGRHPYQAEVPDEYRKAERWFLLETSLTPKELKGKGEGVEFDNANPPPRQTEIPVFALALSLGSEPSREWLVFAHAPERARTGVTITVPGFGPITVDVSQSGSFYHVSEKDRQVRAIIKGGPASFRLEAPRFAGVDAPTEFGVSEKFGPADAIARIRWQFIASDTGASAEEEGERVKHRFARAGQYLVRVVGISGKGTELVSEESTVFVGLEPQPDLVCRLLMKGTPKQGMTSWIWHGGWDKANFSFIPDASGRGNIGFLTGGSWVMDEQRGLVLELSGQQSRVEIGNSPLINTAGSYPQRSVAFWFKAAELKESKNPKVKTVPREVLYEEGGPGAGINIYLEGDVLRAGCWNKGKGAWLEAKELKRTAWHHMAFVVRSEAKSDAEAAIELYLDGDKVSFGKAPTLGAHVGDVNLGRSGSTLFHDGKADGNPGHYFAGRLDDFRLLNRSLTAEEVRGLK